MSRLVDVVRNRAIQAEQSVVKGTTRTRKRNLTSASALSDSSKSMLLIIQQWLRKEVGIQVMRQSIRYWLEATVESSKGEIMFLHRGKNQIAEV